MFNKKHFIKVTLLIALPIVLQNTLTMVVNMLDTLMLSSYGEVQVSASSQANAFISIFQFLSMGIGNGGAVLTAQYWGSKNIPNMKKAITVTLRVSIVSSIIFSLIVGLMNNGIMTLYSPDPEVIYQGMKYLLYSIPSFIFLSLALVLGQVLRSMRQVKIPLVASVVSIVVNLFCNWVFIYGNLGMPEMQIAGAAIGTVIARIIEVIILTVYVFGFDKKIKYKFKDLFGKTDEVTHVYVKYSVPVIVSDLILGVGTSATSVVIGHIGTNFAAANSVVSMIQRIATVFTQGVGIASHTLIGNSVGQHKFDEAKSEAKILLKLSLVFGLGAAIIIYFFGPLMMLYFSSFTEETHAIAIELLDALVIIVVFQALQSVITKGILRGGGDTDYCLKLDATFLWLVSLPLGYLVGIVLRLPPFYCMLALHADWIIKTIIGLFRIHSGNWIRSIE